MEFTCRNLSAYKKAQREKYTFVADFPVIASLA
jgi:hypothetical protein